MAGQKPRQGWIYFINPYKVSLRCKFGHTHIYDLSEPGELQCQTTSCSQKMNSSRVFRGNHPYIFWSNNDFVDTYGYTETFTAIPLTSNSDQKTEKYKGLPTVHPVNSTKKNRLDNNSLALIHQICTVDANCFKDSSGNWLNRIGQLDKADKDAIEERLKYFLNIQDNPSEDWFAQNASPEIVKKVFDYLSEEDKSSVIEELINKLG